MFTKKTDKPHKNILPGIDIKTVAHGEKTLMAEFSMERGAKLPEHSHVYEQTGYLVYGSIILTIGNEKFEAVPGDSWCVASNVSHSAEVLEDSVAIEVFSPVREDYLNNY